jgi:hypothetical protein
MRSNQRNDEVNVEPVEAPFRYESLAALERAYDRTLEQLSEDPTNTVLAAELDWLEDALIACGARFDNPRKAASK